LTATQGRFADQAGAPRWTPEKNVRNYELRFGFLQNFLAGRPKEKKASPVEKGGRTKRGGRKRAIFLGWLRCYGLLSAGFGLGRVGATRWGRGGREGGEGLNRRPSGGGGARPRYPN